MSDPSVLLAIDFQNPETTFLKIGSVKTLKLWWKVTRFHSCCLAFPTADIYRAQHCAGSSKRPWKSRWQQPYALQQSGKDWCWREHWCQLGRVMFLSWRLAWLRLPSTAQALWITFKLFMSLVRAEKPGAPINRNEARMLSNPAAFDVLTSSHLWFTGGHDLAEYSYRRCHVTEPWKCGVAVGIS